MASSTRSWERAVGWSLLEILRGEHGPANALVLDGQVSVIYASVCGALGGGPRTLVEMGRYPEAAVSTWGSPPSWSGGAWWG